MKKERTEKLLKRQKRCVCRQCGGPLEVRLIIHNQFGGQGMDLFCPHCGRIEYGTEPEIYKMAQDFVDKFEFNYYTEMVEDERSRELNIGKVCDIASWIFRQSGQLDDQGLHMKNE
jgi:hypothetical protein